ncbi:MAG: hypothetical protein NUV84_05550, partial [Candidatus Uhrbacteria bacterium]|nr:hypothetical protein [Candidatus Uhrbacteria bacterium]
GKSLSQLTQEGAFKTPSPELSLELVMAARSYIKQLISLTRRGWTSHRDIKPSNLMLGGLVARLIDLGLARTKKEDAKHKQIPSESIMGSPGYFSPLSVTGKFDPDADQYALGLSLAEVLGSIVPASTPDPKAILEAIVNGTYLPTPQGEPDHDDEKIKESFPDRFHLPTERRLVKWLDEMVLPGVYRPSDYLQKREEQLARAKRENRMEQERAQKQREPTSMSLTDRPIPTQAEEEIVQNRLEIYTYLLRELSKITRDHLLFLRAKNLHATLKENEAVNLSQTASHLFTELADALGAQDTEALRRIFFNPEYRPFLPSPKKPLKNRTLGL